MPGSKPVKTRAPALTGTNLFVALLVVGGALAVAGPAEAVYPGRNGKITFESESFWSPERSL